MSKNFWITTLMVGMFFGLCILGYYNETLKQEHNHLTSKYNILYGEHETLKTKHDEVKRVQNLAIEFGLDPLTVILVDKEAEKIVNKSDPEWRLVRNKEYLTFLFLSLIKVESNGNPNAIGDKGKARGLTQIWTSTARMYDEKVTPLQLLRPDVNISISFQHFHTLLQKYQGNFALVLYAWNRGSGRVDNLIRYGEPIENGYGRKVYQAALMHNGLLGD